MYDAAAGVDILLPPARSDHRRWSHPRRPLARAGLLAIVVATLAGCGSSHPLAVSTLAGDGTAGFRNGPARQAEFDNPAGLAVDSAGNVFVADNRQPRIRLIAAGSHAVSTLAGDGKVGLRNGIARRAEFDLPTGVAVDRAGDVFVADSGNEVIRMIAAGSHTVSTLAGDGTRGFTNGPAADARFSSPMGVAVDAAGNVYVADAGNDRIRMIAAGSHTVSTLAGSGAAGFLDGAAHVAEFDHPVSVAVDAAGDVFVADARNNRVRTISAGSRGVSTLAGRGKADFADGQAADAEFDYPLGVSVDRAGNVYVADSLNARVRVIAAGTQIVSTLAGSGTAGFGNGAAQTAEFRGPSAVAATAAGTVYVADPLDERIRTISEKAG